MQYKNNIRCCRWFSGLNPRSYPSYVHMVDRWCLFDAWRKGLAPTSPSTISQFYLTFCTFSFEFKETILSDTRCCIKGDNRMAPRCTRSSLPNCGVKHVNVSNVNKTIEWTATSVTSCAKCSLPQSICQSYFDPCYLLNICFYWNVR